MTHVQHVAGMIATVTMGFVIVLGGIGVAVAVLAAFWSGARDRESSRWERVVCGVVFVAGMVMVLAGTVYFAAWAVTWWEAR